MGRRRGMSIGPWRLALLAVLGFFCLDLRGASSEAALPGWQFLCPLRKEEGNFAVTARWYPESGLRVLVRARQADVRVQLSFSARHFEASLFEPGRVLGTPLPRVLTRLDNALNAPLRDAEVVIKFRPTEWLVYVEQRLLGRLAAPFTPPALLYWPEELAGLLEGPSRFQPVADEFFYSDFMIEEGAPNQLYPWQVQSGDWRIHTALEDALERPESNLDRIKQVPLTAAKSPNFYCLKGKGPDAVIATGYDFYDDYEYSAAVQVNHGEAGILFYLRDALNYYGFTLTVQPAPNENGLLEVWRVRDGERSTLARVRTDLYTDQWYVPKVKIRTDQIRCYLDEIEVARVVEPLPTGGKVGLYARGPAEIRFDDVKLRAVKDLQLDDFGHLRFHTRLDDGRFLPEDGDAGENAAVVLRPQYSARVQRLILGCPENQAVVASAEFELPDPVAEVGLVFGYRDDSKPYYLFTMRRDLAGEVYRLLRVRRNGAVLVRGWRRYTQGTTPRQAVVLSGDASRPGDLRLYKDGMLVLIEAVEAPVVGAAGVYVGALTRTAVRNLRYTLGQLDRFVEQPQRNQAFREDSFMRHWAAPEGQWVAGPAESMWHKGDFFGDFSIRMPCVEGSELHLGIPDGAVNGAACLALHEGRLALRLALGGAQPDTVAEFPLKPPAGGVLTDMAYELHREGYWLWVEVDGQRVLQHRFVGGFPGTRVRVRGCGIPDLAKSQVIRKNVIDDFFYEAPYHWLTNGGTWQIINRFQCTPSWSHMDGENPEGLAALWHKYVFKGDLTLEFYAGLRQGYYHRAGDLNCTIMAGTTAPDSGYTATCTEWDYNHSQKWSSLYRLGQRVDRTDKYLVPRRREGNVRKHQNPLISAGRPIHGAWYYIKIRRIGSRVEFYYDNECVLAYNDSDPLAGGLVGIWTFMNSMTVAQVKITFEHAAPRPFAFERLPVRGPDFRAPLTPLPAPEPEASGPDVAVNAFPLDSLAPNFWRVQDPVGHARLESFRLNANGLRLCNQLGSGPMFVASDLPIMPLDRVAGWRFYLKRTPRARLNFHYTIGSLDAKGDYSIRDNLFHHLNGTDFTEGEYDLTGRSAVPSSTAVDVAGGDWHLVQVWIPTRLRQAYGSDRWRVRVEGFGHRQPNDIMGGIGGSWPGDAYAVRQFTPVFYGRPVVTLAEDAARPATWEVSRDRQKRVLARVGSAAELTAWLAQKSDPGLNVMWLRAIDGEGQGLGHELAWIDLPEHVPFDLAWDDRRADTVALRALGAYPDPRFSQAKLRLDGHDLPLEASNAECRYAWAPRRAALPATLPDELTFSVDPGSGPETRTFDRRTAAVNTPPVLGKVEGLTPFLETFEGYAGPQHLQLSSDGRMILRRDPVQGRYLAVRNRVLGQRLVTPFRTGFSVAQYPVLQFRYRAFDMTHLTAVFSNGHSVWLNEDQGSPGRRVRLGEALEVDRSWRTWIGLAADAFVSQAFDASRYVPGTVTFQSSGDPDQTGRYSTWHVDDVVFGPAVSGAEQLRFTPHYADSDGVGAVFTAVAPGAVCFADLDRSARDALDWQAHDPGATIVPDISGLDDGPHHLLVKASDTQGAESAVTDIPFLLDTKPLTGSFAFERMADPASNGVQLRVTFTNGGGAPWDIGAAAFTVCGEQRQIPAWTNLLLHDAANDSLVLNYPFLFRAHLDQGQDGDTFEFGIENIVDGAGNRTPRLNVPVKIDYASDKTGPAWYTMDISRASVLAFWNWDGRNSKDVAFAADQHNLVDVEHTAGQSPYLSTRTYQSTGGLSHAVNWQPEKHPWLSFRMRLPSYKAGKGLRLFCVLAAGSRTYRLSLIEPSRAQNELNRTRAITWRAGRWQRLSFNVVKLLQEAGVSAADIAKLRVNSVSFNRAGAANRESLDLDDFFIHAGAGAAPDVLSWVAYDASGVAALELVCVGENDQELWRETAPGENVDLQPFRARAVGHSWLRCCARDKAGNLSVPFWVPFPQA